ncbi:MAG: class I SAM-dependent methyltransferase [candidate division Zixibacteria bacterium]|nr:class I SAM-dependent methyltransferase [candidate division Zixibacteria bacterium]
MTNLSVPYSKLATVYDQMGADNHSINMVEYTENIFRRFNIRPTSGLDLCCGTGTAIVLMRELGLEMSGLDGSAAMLAVAARKLKGLKVKLYQKTLPKFRIIDDYNSRKTQTFDLITCFYDSLNYLRNAQELEATFRSVGKHLESGGWFIFNMNTPASLKTIWGGQVYADAQDEIAWVWKNEYHTRTKTATVVTTVFTKNGKLWERFDERHTERAYSNTELKKILSKTGFSVKGLFRCATFERPTRDATRVCIVARKR